MSQKTTRTLLALTVSATSIGFAPQALHAEELTLEEIIVTARHRGENLQDVPDNVTAFDASKIESAGITDIGDFVNLTPGVVVRETFRAGVTFITIRGVTTSQQGWAPITYVVDGVKAGSLDAINQGALVDIERIEVLKGPQGALYGAGAIAGAVNVVTKQPTNESEHQLKLSYGKGDDKTLSATSSGALIDDTLLYRVNGYYRDTDGLIDDTDGDHLDFETQSSVRGRLIFHASDDLTLEASAAYSDINAGAAYQEKVDSADLIDVFDSSRTPGPRRGIIGEENRTFTEASVKLDWDLGFATLTSVTGYQDIEQDLFGSASWDKPPTATSVFGPVFGSAALAGEAIDDFQDLADNFETYTQDIRLTSKDDGNLRWVLGAEYLQREAINQLGVGRVMGPAPGTLLYLLNRFDERNDKLWGVYGQINYDLSERLELTLAGRYDKNTYDTRNFDPATGNTIATLDENGNTVSELENEDSKFQPKVQLAYDISDDLMIYGTWAKGFRTGFFNTGNPTAAETTENYEFGFKSTTWNGRARVNGAIYRIDYSDQQNTSVIATPPFRITQNIPESEISGAELEVIAQATDNLQVELGLSYIDTEIEGEGIGTPATPDWTVNLGLQHERVLTEDLTLVSRLDYRYQGDMYLRLNFPTEASPGFEEQYGIDSKEYVNLRVGVEHESWTITAFGKNLLDTRQANDFSQLGGFVRAMNKPRSYGVEFAYRF
ncbi:TonB-dependent receptor [Pseudomaricurvus alkylphenolicus]|uniref:TonB-dependent receptor n=1 Tax=Pseudomaricurvus alkylphenolicus TaxID=1306991 RepID=UPI00141E7A29|nr:TonB-dependent receptor [Pseudomaricurvus alkylphenolicus]NIB40695.1 TonB-dependent receptor [Pseudomaricurvus alkylphenolicus]